MTTDLPVLIIHLGTAMAHFYWLTCYYHSVHDAMQALLPRMYTLLDVRTLNVR